MKITATADGHGEFPTLEGGDLLIVAGDLTARDYPHERMMFLHWLAEQDYRKKIWIAGNHDNSLVGMTFSKLNENSAEYLCDSGTEFEGLKIWGCPQSLWFDEINPRCEAFTGSESDLKKYYDNIPDDIDILISHTPPHGILDKNKWDHHCGSKSLLETLRRVKPKYLICGHIHEAYGRYELLHADGSMTICLNVSHMDGDYEPVNEPVYLEI